MKLIKKFKKAVRGDVKPHTLVLETLRRARSRRQSRDERARLVQLNEETPKLAVAHDVDLLAHFRGRTKPSFFSGFSEAAAFGSELVLEQRNELLLAAQEITTNHSWPLLGFGQINFGKEVCWRRDPLSGFEWPLEYHRDLQLIRTDGSDARVLWELNRLGHLLTLACAYSISGDENYFHECTSQLQGWTEQNPYGRGINWSCAMEVGLRAMNLLAVFQLLKNSAHFDYETLQLFLKLFHQHGTYITNNLEFSHLATSNHYLSDVMALLWLGVMLAEFVEAESWLKFGFAEMLREMDKQVLPDGADFESSTGYHRFVLELFLYSFLLCRDNDVEIEARYWDKLRQMLEYIRAYLRPDHLAPMIGDSDGGQVLPIVRRAADDHAYVLAIGATVFNDGTLKLPGMKPPGELFWMLGARGLADFDSLQATGSASSLAFPDAGIYVMRDQERYLLLNASDAGLNGRGSHGHNDALSVEVSVGSRPFIIDAGTYVYTADLHQRHLFRSTAFHSTVQIDGEEQNTTVESLPFVIGNEARPRVLTWETSSTTDRLVAEHFGYRRLPSPVTHRRTIIFHKSEGYWLLEDEFFGESAHTYEVRFHFAPGLEVKVEDCSVVAIDRLARVGLVALPVKQSIVPVLEAQHSSRNYGTKEESLTACWRVSGTPGKLKWRIEETRAELSKGMFDECV